MAVARVPSKSPKLNAFAKWGGFFIHSAQTVASSEVKGVAQTRQQGPAYFSIPHQHAEQKGASLNESGSFPHEGHSEGYRKLKSLGIRPEL